MGSTKLKRHSYGGNVKRDRTSFRANTAKVGLNMLKRHLGDRIVECDRTLPWVTPETEIFICSRRVFHPPLRKKSTTRSNILAPHRNLKSDRTRFRANTAKVSSNTLKRPETYNVIGHVSAPPLQRRAQTHFAPFSERN
eukprot:scaffold3533_cov97-Cylindrotheca_fusiformis.AAC.3